MSEYIYYNNVAHEGLTFEVRTGSTNFATSPPDGTIRVDHTQRSFSMTLDQTKAKVTARIWQSIAQSGVSVSSIPQDQLDTLVDSIADGVLVAVNDFMEDAGLPVRTELAADTPAAGEETILWEGRPFLSFVTWYQITSERVRIIRGLLRKDRDDIELVRIQDLDLNQGVTERAVGVGDIIIHSSDPSTPTAVLNNVTEPQQVHEILRRAMLEARKRFRYSVQEEM